MKKMLLMVILLLFVGCSNLKIKHYPRIATEELNVTYTESKLKPDPKPIYVNKCSDRTTYADILSCLQITGDGVYYTTMGHDILNLRLENCAECNLGKPKRDIDGNILKDSNGNILREKSHIDIMLNAYSTAIFNHNQTIKDRNLVVDEYYKEKSKKKAWMYTAGVSGGVMSILILLLIVL